MFSAGILIWQGSVRTKKTISVEEKLRNALSLPLAIAIPRTQDGTVIAGHNKSLMPNGHDDPTVTRTRTNGEMEDGASIGETATDKGTDSGHDSKGDHQFIDPLGVGAERPDVNRRSTVAFGPSGEKEIEARERGVSLAAPGYTPAPLELGPPIKK